MRVPLSRVIEGSKSDAILGISDRPTIVDFINRGIELYADKANWDIWIDNIDVCSDHCGLVTLPIFVDTPLQVNVGGLPTTFRNEWFNFHVNGPGDFGCGAVCGFSTDRGWSPTFRDLKEWSMIAAICEDPIDGNGALKMIVEGTTVDGMSNPKEAFTLPASGPSSIGVQIPLLMNWASTDPRFTWFNKITRVTKPVTRGYVKLIGFPQRSLATAVTLGYYGPNETDPMYRRIRVGATCTWVRVRYRMVQRPLINDWDVVPIASYQAMLDLIKAVKLSDSNNVDASEAYLAKALRLVTEIQNRSASYSPMQVDKSFSIGTIDYR